MNLDLQIMEDYKQAMRDKDDIKKLALNYVLGLIKNKKIEIQKDPSNDDIIQIIKKEIKNIQESITFLEKNGDTEAIAEENQKIEIITKYLPQSLSEAQLKDLINERISELSITDLKTQRGILTKSIMDTHKSVIDGKMFNDIITSML